MVAPDPVQNVKTRILARSYLRNQVFFHTVFHVAVENPGQIMEPKLPPLIAISELTAQNRFVNLENSSDIMVILLSLHHAPFRQSPNPSQPPSRRDALKAATP